MKKRLIFLCLGVFLLCGCEAKVEAKFSINEDKSMNTQMLMGFDEEMIDFMMSTEETESENTESTLEDENLEKSEELEETKEYTDEERMEYIRNSFQIDSSNYENGFTIKEYKDEKYMGYLITKTIDNIDNLVGTPDFSLDSFQEIDSKKIFTKDGSKYKAKILVGEITNGNEEINTSQYNSMNFINYTFVLNLPNKVISSNATSVSEDGKTLIWNLASGNIETIEFEFEFPSLLTFIKGNMFIVAAIAVVVVLAIVVIITLFIKKGKDKVQNQNTLKDIPQSNINEPVMKKNDEVNITTLETLNNTQVNNNEQSKITEPQPNIIQPINSNPQPMSNQIIQSQQQTINTTPIINAIEQTITPVQNVNQTQNINTTANIQTSNNLNQNQITEVKPIMQTPLTQNTIQQQNPNVWQNINNNSNINGLPKEEFTIPEIKPIMPEKLIIPGQQQNQANQQNVTQQLNNQQSVNNINSNNGQGI